MPNALIVSVRRGSPGIRSKVRSSTLHARFVRTYLPVKWFTIKDNIAGVGHWREQRNVDWDDSDFVKELRHESVTCMRNHSEIFVLLSRSNLK